MAEAGNSGQEKTGLPDGRQVFRKQDCLPVRLRRTQTGLQNHPDAFSRVAS